MKTLSDKLLEVLENNGFLCDGNVTEQDGDYYIEINQNTPKGEDWWETIWFDGTEEGFIKAIFDRASSFNVDEEVEVYIDIRGTRGVPDSIEDLMKDAKWKKETLRTLSRALQNEKSETTEKELALTNCCLYVSMNDNETQEEAENRVCELLSNLGIMLGDYDAEFREL